MEFISITMERYSQGIGVMISKYTNISILKNNSILIYKKYINKKHGNGKE